MYATRSATVEYDAYETEKAEFLRQNPSLRHVGSSPADKMEEARLYFGSLAKFPNLSWQEPWSPTLFLVYSQEEEQEEQEDGDEKCRKLFLDLR